MKFDEIPGWFMPIDQAAFSWILQHQNKVQSEGSLVELGVFMGKSAVLIGNHRRDAEVFTCVDLFEDIATSDQADPGERQFFTNQGQTQAAFERNYLAFHRVLPRVVRGPTAVLTRYVAPQTVRFVHADAGQTYELLRQDIASARTVLRQDGVVAFGDYRKPATIGTAAAVWEAILNDGLKPIAHTDFKLYATWGDPAPYQADLIARAAEAGWCTTQQGVTIRDMPMVYLHRKA